MLYKLEDNKINAIKEDNYSLEKEIENLVNNNLNDLTGLQLIDSQCKNEGYKYDAVAYDKESNAFIIVEYKKIGCDHMVDQGFAYLGTMLNKKAEFVLKFNIVNNTKKEVKDFDWSQTRVMFISPEFTNYQLDAHKYIKLPFELYYIKKFGSNLFSFEKIEDKRTNKIDLANLGIIPEDNKTINEIKFYSEEDHFKYGSSNTNCLYKTIKERMSEWGDFTTDPKKTYIAFKGRTNIADFSFHKSGLGICINLKKGELKDVNNVMTDCSTKGHIGNGSYQCILKSDKNLDYVLSLIKQSWDKNK